MKGETDFGKVRAGACLCSTVNIRPLRGPVGDCLFCGLRLNPANFQIEDKRRLCERIVRQAQERRKYQW